MKDNVSDRWALAAEEDYYRRFVGVDYFHARKISLRTLPEFRATLTNARVVGTGLASSATEISAF